MVENGYSYSKNLLIAIDQLMAALFGFPCDETISSVAYRWELEGKRKWTRIVIDALFYMHEKEHCKKSYEAELDRSQMHPSMRLTGEE